MGTMLNTHLSVACTQASSPEPGWVYAHLTFHYLCFFYLGEMLLGRWLFQSDFSTTTRGGLEAFCTTTYGPDMDKKVDLAGDRHLA